ncbi:MAG: hypothetical protein IT452_08935 [Planctomycetia bacterium]|nr:hypothetical protein [Planctomycetia bacterium]
MSVSRAKAFRLVTELRRGGHKVVVVKTGRTWHFEVHDDFQALWADDPVLKHAGFIRTGPVLRPGESVDDVLYGPLKKQP